MMSVTPMMSFDEMTKMLSSFSFYHKNVQAMFSADNRSSSESVQRLCISTSSRHDKALTKSSVASSVLTLSEVSASLPPFCLRSN